MNCFAKVYLDRLQSSNRGGWALVGCTEVRNVEVVGIVTDIQHFHKSFNLTVDDGTGIIRCQCRYESETRPSWPQSIFCDALAEARPAVELGNLIRVRGLLTNFRMRLELIVSSYSIESDPMAQPLHWLECDMLYRTVYSKREAAKP